MAGNADGSILSMFTDDNNPHHAHPSVDLASDDVNAGLAERHLRILVRLTINGLCTVWDHAIDGVDIMSSIGGDEVDRVAGLDAHQFGVKHEKAGRARGSTPSPGAHRHGQRTPRNK